MQYGLSIDAMMYKAKELGIITEQRHKGYCIKKNRSSNFRKQVEENRYPQEESRRFQVLVYKAISQEVISIGKASSLLNCSVMNPFFNKLHLKWIIIVVNDTNIFIDLMSVDLLDDFFRLPIEIHTTDFVLNELTDESQHNAIQKHIS